MEPNEEQSALLKRLYYDEKLFFGRDKLHQYIMKNYPDALISRRMLQTWLDKQKIYQLTKPPPVRHPVSAMTFNRVGFYCCDIVGPLPRDKLMNYFFSFLELSTRKLYTHALRTKESPEVRDALKTIIETNDLKVSVCYSDNGGEFKAEFAEFLKERDIKQIFSQPHSPWSNPVERYHRTIKAALYKNELHTKKKDWVDVLPVIVDGINKTWNRSLRTDSNSAELLPDEIREERLISYGSQKKHRQTRSTLKIGDIVRLRIRYAAGYAKKKQTYSTMKYLVTKVIHGNDTRLVTYKISDGVNERKGVFSILDLLKIENKPIDSRYQSIVQDDDEDYELVDENAVGARSIQDQREVDQLLEQTEKVAPVRETRRPKPVSGTDDVYLIESILKRRKFNKRFKYLVKYVGYPISDATWEFPKDIDAPELMKAFMETLKKKK